MPRKLWTRDELIVTLALYFQLPFGRLNHGTSEVKRLAALLGRSDNSVALRLVNFAACDPYIINSGRHGMASGVPICQPVWNEFANDKERLFFESERIKAQLMKQPIEKVLKISKDDLIGKEREAVVRQRVNQNAFRSMILNNYEEHCAITGINVPELLVASHIVPWAESTPAQKLNPENGICLSALYDEAFDKGFIAISPEDYTVMLSRELKGYSKMDYYQQHFGSIEHQRIMLPEEHKPNAQFLEYHFNNIFGRRN